MCFTAAIPAVVLIPFGRDPEGGRELFHLEGDGVGGIKEEPLA